MREEYLRAIAFATAVLISLACVPAARAAVRFDPATGYFPSGYSRPTSSFDTFVPPLAAEGSALELGFTQPCPQAARRGCRFRRTTRAARSSCARAAASRSSTRALRPASMRSG